MDGRLKLITEGGAESHAELKAGEPYFRPVGVEHDVINDGASGYAFIEVEMK
jgi:mannose-6-phosphate isomerase-like protein (cupin superfamily)